MRPTRVLVSVAVSLAAVLLVGCGTQDATGPDGAGTVTPPAATTPAVGPDEPTQSLTGTLVRNELGAWYLELERDDQAAYDARRLNVMMAEDWAITCQGTDRQLPVSELPDRVRATVKFTYVLDTDPVSLPPTAIMADC